MNISLSVVSVNSRGLRGHKKRTRVFNTLKDKVSNGIFLFQETHSDKNEYEKWRREWGSEIYMIHGQTNSKGVMITFSKYLDFKNLQYIDDKKG